MEQAIAKIKAARDSGQQVTADIYPYINNGLGIAAFIHPRHFTQGRERLLRRLDEPDLRKQIRREMETEGSWENWYRHVGADWNKVVLGSMQAAPYSQYNGRTLAKIAEAMNQDEWETFFQIAKRGAFALPQSMSEANKIRAMRQEFMSFCTDVGPAGRYGGARIASHPRAYGSFPRILSRYVRELGVLSLEQAIVRMSAIAANEVLAFDRGRLAVGLAADVVVFDYLNIRDAATLAKPQQYSSGMKYVLVNGQVVLESGQFTGARPGQVLRGPGYQTR